MQATSSSSSPHPFTIPADCVEQPLVAQKCTRCSYAGPTQTFPPRRTGGGHLKVCATCMDKQNARKVASEIAAADTLGHRGQIATAAMSFDDFLNLVTVNKTRPFDFDTMVSVPPGFFVAGEHLYNRSNRIRDFLAEASDYHWNQKKTKRGGKSSVVTYFCAQLEGEQSKSRTQDTDRKSRSRITRYHCGGWLRITVMDDNEQLLRIRMTHAEAHPSFPASFRRPPHTSEFKLESAPPPPLPLPPPPPPPPPPHLQQQHHHHHQKSVSSVAGAMAAPPVLPPAPPAPPSAPPSTIFAGMQHAPRLMVEQAPPGLPAPSGPPPPGHPAVPQASAQPSQPQLPQLPDGLEADEHAAAAGAAVETVTVTVLSPEDSPRPVVYFAPEQLSGLKRKFEDMMVAARGPVTPDVAHALGSVFDHIERTAADVDLGRFKRQRI